MYLRNMNLYTESNLSSESVNCDQLKESDLYILYITNMSMQSDMYNITITESLPVSVSSSLPVDVLLKAVGDTPIMKTKKWAVERGRTVQSLAQFISRFLKLDSSEQLVPIISSLY